MVKNMLPLLAIGSAILLGCEAQKQPEPEANPEQPPAFGFPAARNRTKDSGVQFFICTQQIAAYDPSNPSKQLGFFKTGSELQLTITPAPPGMVLVTYQDPSGQLITALCRAEDVGVAPPPSAYAPPPQQQEPEKPKGLGGSRPPQQNPNFKSLGGGL